MKAVARWILKFCPAGRDGYWFMAGVMLAILGLSLIGWTAMCWILDVSKLRMVVGDIAFGVLYFGAFLIEIFFARQKGGKP